MNSAVSRTPITAAWALASMAAAPSVAPTVRCSITSTGTGSAPPRIRTARSLASFAVNDPVIWVEPPAMPTSQGTDGSTCGDEMTWSSSTIATRRVGSLGAAHAAAAVSCCQAEPPLPLKSTVTDHLLEPLRVELGLGAVDAFAGESRRADPDGLAVLVGQHLLTVGSRRCRRGRVSGRGRRRRPDDGVEAELRGAADDVGRLARVLQARQLDDDPAVAGPGEGRLGDARARRPGGAAPRPRGRWTPCRPSRSASPGSPGRSGCRRAGRDRGGREW